MLKVFLKKPIYGCMSGLADMYQDYIDGKREIRDINMSFNASYVWVDTYEWNGKDDNT